MTVSKYILGILLIAASFSSCKKWLDVQPKTEMRRDELFTSQTGFQDALSGVYIQMKDSMLYGYHLSVGAIEHLISSWDVASNTMEQRINRFNFQDADVENLFSASFSKQYNAIAGINAILDQIDSKTMVFTTPGMYEMIKGECLAIRAYLHFDLLRLYGPVPELAGATPVLPYVKKLSVNPSTHISYTAFKDAVMADLSEAEKLLKDIDPILKFSLGALGNPNSSANNFRPDDLYQAFRQFRMNYYAIKALQARAWNWFGEKDKAYECAKLVVEAKDPDGSVKFKLATDADFSTGDLVMSKEHIWSLYDFDLFKKNNFYFTGGKLYKGTNTDTKVKSELFENSASDIRPLRLWNIISTPTAGKFNVIKKYQSKERVEYFHEDLKRWPMLRIAEMYMIIMECGPVAEAQQAWNAYAMARNIPLNILPADPVGIRSLLIKEYRKDFFAEGQSFYLYKRHNLSKFLWAPGGYQINYVVPLPKNEFIR